MRDVRVIGNRNTKDEVIRRELDLVRQGRERVTALSEAIHLSARATLNRVRKLEAKGERIDKDFAGLTVWGRINTGSGIASDGVIVEIYNELHREGLGYA